MGWCVCGHRPRASRARRRPPRTWRTTRPRPHEDTVAQLYTEDYPQYQPPARRGGKLRALRQKLFGHRERTLADRIPVRPGGKLLDCGCGAGAFAAEMRARGWDAFGLDFS